MISELTRSDEVEGYDAKGKQTQGKVHVHDIRITKVVDSATPLLVGQPDPTSPTLPTFGLAAPTGSPW